MAKKITKIVAQKRNPNRVSIFLDDEYSLSLSRITAAWLSVGSELTDAQISSLSEADSKEEALQRALNYLHFRPRSEAEIQQYLIKYQFDDQTISNTLERLRESDLVNDRKFAELWVENRTSFNPRGKRGLKFELLAKKIDPAIVDDVLHSVDEEDLAYQAARNRANRIPSLDRERFHRTLGGFLARRGFSNDVVFLVTRRIWEERSQASSED